jgi:hypothetical protein
MRYRPTCPICGGDTVESRDYIEHTMCESSTECREGCGLYSHTFTYGNVEIQVGYSLHSWSWSGDGPTADDRAKQAAAEEELRRAYRHPHFAAVWKSPPGVLADWLGEHGFPIQEAAVRESITLERVER